MSLAVSIAIEQDTATKAVAEVVASMNPRALAQKLEGPLVLLVQHNFRAHAPNKMGWPSTHFWADCVRATHSTIDDAGLTIEVAKIGVRQRFHGGTIRAGAGISSKTGRPTKYLAIPARAEAYGKNPSEFSNLKMLFHKSGGSLVAYALAAGPETTIRNGGRAQALGEVGSLIFFWLTPSVNQEPDPTVLPSDEQFSQTIEQALTA